MLKRGGPLRRDKRLKRAGVAGAALLTAIALAGCASDGSGAAAGSAAVPIAPAWHFVSRPDLTPPIVTATPHSPSDSVNAAGTSGSDGDYVLLGPKDTDNGSPMTGEEIVDDHGNPVWVNSSSVGTFNFTQQTYQGKPVLTYWKGPSTFYGNGDVVILNENYQQVATVTTGGDLGPHKADMHESLITPQGTMLLTSYPKVQVDLTSVGGPKDGWVFEGVAQEVDIATGKVLFEWKSLDHVPLTDSYQPLGKGDGTKDQPYDYFHINSVQDDGADQVLVSSRDTHAVYEISRSTGETTWQLGGKHSSFTMGPDATFSWQHDARRQADGTITLFDNDQSPNSSRGLRLSLDTSTMTATVAAQYLPPTKRMSATQGNVQVLPSGNVLVGWGSEPYYSEYSADGTLLSDHSFGGGTSYRAYLANWVGAPTTPPDVVVAGSGASAVVYVSWNGATEVSSWRVLSGSSAATATVVGTETRGGFETAIAVPNPGAYVAVQALDSSGKVIGAGLPKT